MNARFLSKIQVGVTVTALATAGALALGSGAGCAGGGGDSNGGSNGNGGSSNGGSSGSNGGSSGNTGGGSGSCTASADSVCFAGGQASGLMTGYGWIALGQFDTATAPVCDNTANGGTASDPITKANPCPETGGKTVWTTPDSGLCLTGKVPKVGTTAGVTGPDYTGYWGLEVGANSGASGDTIDISKYSKVSFSFNTSGVTPAPTGLIRGEIHVKGHTPSDESYCAIITPGTATQLTTFNTACWGTTGTNLTASDMKNIDNMGVQISSDSSNDYTVNGFCLTGISFSN